MKTKSYNIPRIFGSFVTSVIGEVNQGKTMFLATLIDQINKNYAADVYVFEIRPEITKHLRVKYIYSLEELERLKNCFVIVDECATLFKPNNRKAAHLQALDQAFRLIAHNNVRLLVCGLERDFNKEFSGRIGTFGFKTLSKTMLINGSLAKMRVEQYQGEGAGYSRLDIPVEKVMFIDNDGIWFEEVPYMEKFDTKKANRQDLFAPKGA